VTSGERRPEFDLVAFGSDERLVAYHRPDLVKGPPMASIAATTDSTFDADVLKHDGPVLVDFWAPWCGPCKAIAPILEEIAAEHGDKLKIVKLNTDENPAITARYGITGIPALNVYSGGELVKSVVGAQPKPKLLRELEPFIG